MALVRTVWTWIRGDDERRRRRSLDEQEKVRAEVRAVQYRLDSVAAELEEHVAKPRH